MSYTLRGRIESRLGAAALPFVVAALLSLLLHRWWPVELAGLMVAVGLGVDLVLHRVLDYQPGWAALPIGLAELGIVTFLARSLDLGAPLWAALTFYAFAWVVAQALGHAGFPLAHLTYGDDGGELGRAGSGLRLLAPVALLAVLGVAWASQPPLVRLEAGVHQGPLLLDRSQRLVAEPGAIVRGGIRITADDVTVRGVTVVGGQVGIEVDEAERVELHDVSVTGATRDGISARLSSVAVHDCVVHSLAGSQTQAIDLSFGATVGESVVEGCTVIGGYEGIVTHMAHARIHDNRVSGTTFRAITMTEMSMGEVSRNEIRGARGVGIFCGDWSHCEIEDNVVVGTSRDLTAGRTRDGYAIESHYYASAHVDDNRLVANANDYGVFLHAEIRESDR